MEIRQLKTFIKVVSLLSFTKTANELGYAQSSITSQIQALEEEFGTKLFERLGKQIKLTKDGEHLYIYANQILKLAQEAKEQISNSLVPRGSLTIGTAESLCTHRLPEIFKTFRTQYPSVDINIRLDTCTDFRSHLRKNIIDILIFLDVPLQDEDFITHILYEEPMTVIAAPGHPLIKKQKVMPHDINSQALVLTDMGCSYRRIFESILAQAGAKPSSVLAFSSNECIKKFVHDGWGIGFLPKVTVAHELTTGQLIALPWAGPPFNIKSQLIYHKDKWISPAMRAFIDLTLKLFSTSEKNISR